MGCASVSVVPFDALDGHIPVIDVIKSPTQSTICEEVFGETAIPLYVTAAGMDEKQAALKIQSMQGRYRLPTLLERVDRLTRSGFVT